METLRAVSVVKVIVQDALRSACRCVMCGLSHLKEQPVITFFKQSRSQCIVYDRFLLQKSQTETKKQNKDRALEYSAVKRRPGARLNSTPRGPYQPFRNSVQPIVFKPGLACWTCRHTHTHTLEQVSIDKAIIS